MNFSVLSATMDLLLAPAGMLGALRFKAESAVNKRMLTDQRSGPFPTAHRAMSHPQCMMGTFGHVRTGQTPASRADRSDASGAADIRLTLKDFMRRGTERRPAKDHLVLAVAH